MKHIYWRDVELRTVTKLSDTLYRVVIVVAGQRLIADRESLEECFDSLYDLKNQIFSRKKFESWH